MKTPWSSPVRHHPASPPTDSVEEAPAALSTPDLGSPRAKARPSPARSPQAETMEDYFKFSEIKRLEIRNANPNIPVSTYDTRKVLSVM